MSEGIRARSTSSRSSKRPVAMEFKRNAVQWSNSSKVQGKAKTVPVVPNVPSMNRCRRTTTGRSEKFFHAEADQAECLAAGIFPGVEKRQDQRQRGLFEPGQGILVHADAVL
jgi:hypothetical protein